MNTKEEYKKYLTDWLNGIPSEINFWYHNIRTKAKRFMSEEEWQIRTSFESPFLLEKELWLKETDFLDVGSGPYSNCGFKTDKTKLTFTAVDPLASVYSKIKEKFKLVTPINPKTAMVENLSSCFKENTFDIVHMSNSLDHSFDPILGLWQMLWVCKKGGKIILRHAENEAEHQKYCGLHQWNIEIKDNACYFWRKDKRINIATTFGDFITIKKLDKNLDSHSKQYYTYIVIMKNKDVPLHFNENYPMLLESFLEYICLLNYNEQEYQIINTVKQVISKKKQLNK